MAFWADIRIALTLIIFIYLVKWMEDLTKSKALAIILGAAIAYFTFFKHFEILIFIVIFFFGYPFFEAFSKGFIVEDKK